jgi:hypothetical protein
MSAAGFSYEQSLLRTRTVGILNHDLVLQFRVSCASSVGPIHTLVASPRLASSLPMAGAEKGDLFALAPRVRLLTIVCRIIVGIFIYYDYHSSRIKKCQRKF